VSGIVDILLEVLLESFGRIQVVLPLGNVALTPSEVALRLLQGMPLRPDVALQAR
jgi:hypothetical protein